MVHSIVLAYRCHCVTHPTQNNKDPECSALRVLRISFELEHELEISRLKKKSQSVDIPDEGYAGSLVKDLLASPLIQNVARSAIREEKEINTTNIQKARSPRRGELKRGYTI
ncbi:hypothetical protein cypCar_00032443, partial [Cyprinus carpio]